jgi:hypothetical protein
MPFAGAGESVRVVRLVLAAAAAGGADARQLAVRAGVPGWALADEGAMISSCQVLRLWELAEQALGDPDVALGVAARCQLGDLGLYDYLFSTAATLGQGLDAAGRYLPIVAADLLGPRPRLRRAP